MSNPYVIIHIFVSFFCAPLQSDWWFFFIPPPFFIAFFLLPWSHLYLLNNSFPHFLGGIRAVIMLFLILIVIFYGTLPVNFSTIVFSFICYVFSFCKYFLYSQNAGAVIGKGGKNIKALRTDVSTFYTFHTPWIFILVRVFILYSLFFPTLVLSLPKLPSLLYRTAVFLKQAFTLDNCF